MHALLFAFALCSSLQTVVSDTPPPPPSAEKLTRLQTMSDVIGVSVLADGKPAPPATVLPVLVNRRQTIEYMLVNYPSGAAPKENKPVIGWVLVNRSGRVERAMLATRTENAEFDSLSTHVLRMAEFQPAQVGADTVSIWIPLPARVPSRGELSAAIADADFDRTRTPVELPFDTKPVLMNRPQVEAAIVRVVYQVNSQVAAADEAFRRAERVGGKLFVWLYITESGSVGNVILKKTSGNSDLDAAGLQVARTMRFSPARSNGKPTDVWIEVPINFRAP